MSQTLDTFLIGIGLDFQTDDVKKVNSGLDSVKRTAMQAGAAVAGAFGTKAVTADVANRTRGYTLLAEQIGSTANAVASLDSAYTRAGGGAGEIVGQLEQLKELQAGLQVGNVEWISRAAMAGIDTGGIINEQDPTEIFRNVIGQLEGMSTNQRINAINALGLNPTAINLAEDGLAELDAQIQKSLDRRSISESLQKDSEIFATQWSDMWENIYGITDRAGTQIIPAVNEITGSINDFFDANRDNINSGADEFFGKIADNLDSLAIAGVAVTASGVGTTLAGMAKAVPIIGGGAKTFAAFAKSLGAIGVAAAGINLVMNEGGKGGALSAGSIFGENSFTDFLDTPISELFGGDSNKQYSPEELDVMRAELAKGIPSFSPTVITPSQTAPLSAPVMSAQSYTSDRGKTFDPYNQQSQATRPRTLQPINIQIGNQAIKQIVVDIIDEEEKQAVKDLRSPLTR
ncbi:putative gp55 tail-fiber/lysozyme protein [Vibrio phage 191E37-1]|nr:putative gp55 tail-fiber/lysozyme protein [Vibrio phage 191E37-1]